MGRIIYDDVSLESLLSNHGNMIVLVAKLLNENAEERTRQVEEAPEHPYHYHCSQYSVEEILYNGESKRKVKFPNISSPAELSSSQPKIEVGQTILVTSANVSEQYNLHVGYYVRGISRSVGYSRLKTSVESVEEGESYVIMIQRSSFDPELFQWAISQSYEYLNKLEQIKAILSSKQPSHAVPDLDDDEPPAPAAIPAGPPVSQTTSNKSGSSLKKPCTIS